jgi:AcrR family transcriptional regulator
MRELIAERAGEMFRQYSVRSITMDDIANRMGISKKTLYTWYIDKNDLVETVYLNPLKLAQQECERRMAGARDAVCEAFQCWHSLRDVFVFMHEGLLHDLQKYHHKVFARYDQFKKDFLYKLICANIERGKAEQLYRSAIETEIIASHEIAVMDINYSSFPGNNRKWSFAVIGEQLMLQYLHGLVTSKGLKLIEKYHVHNHQS